MDEINITFPDGSSQQFQKGVTGQEIAAQLGNKIAQDAVAVKVGEAAYDLSEPIQSDAQIRILTFQDEEGREIFRHSAAHLLAHAVKNIFPQAQLTIGPAVEDGFYYDFDVEQPFTQEDLKKIEEEMKRLSREDISFERIDNVPVEDAKERVKHEPYKLELIDELGDDTCTFYRQGDFEDLCSGPHLPSTGKIKAFKLTKIAGAYWRGNAENRQLQRIYGVAFPDKKELKEYLRLLEEAQKRDHRKLGKELKLFSTHDEAPGFPFWHPNGLVIFNKLLEYWRELHQEAGYVEIKTPIIMSRKLWERSGHWQNYGDEMYFTRIDGEDHAIKPMNCPGGMLMFQEDVHSYRDLPLRVGEIGFVHRHELSGTLSGLFRARAFHQDDAHIYMTEEHIQDEILGVLRLVDTIYRNLGLSYHIELSTRPEKSIGTDEQWEKATEGLKGALEATGTTYYINEGDGAFYGPKIDFHIKDALHRTWQCGTIQLDMAQPENFDLVYEGQDGNKHRPVMIHRTIYGSMERFIGILIEHFAGKFPLWLNPVQARIVTIADRHMEFAERVKRQYADAGLRVDIDNRAQTVSKKVREAQLNKVNYVLVIGDEEINDETVNVRSRENEVLGKKKPDQLLSELQREVAEKRI